MTGSAVSLSDGELVLLDGRCRHEVQVKVDAARERIASRAARPHLPPALAGLVADVVSRARQHGRIVWAARTIGYCRLCGRSGGHAPYKSGPNKGLPNLNKPVRFGGIELASRVVTIDGHVSLGGCRECVEPLAGEITDALRGVPAEVPDCLRAAGEPVRKRFDRRCCTACGWEGHEGEMRRMPTVLGDGTYPGGCPSCPAANRAFAPTRVVPTDGFEIVEEPR